MFDTLLIVTLFLQASLFVCLLTLTWSISITPRPPHNPFIKFIKDRQFPYSG